MFEAEISDLIWYVDHALSEMAEILSGLGDELANERPPLEGANSPFAIVTHCLGVTEYWGGVMIAGRTVVRDRPAEFRATGEVDHLLGRLESSKKQFADDLGHLDPLAPPRGPIDPEDTGRPLARSQAGVVLHVLEELYQHLGHLELSRDILRGAAR